MRPTVLFLAALAGVCGFSGVASAFHKHKYVVPVVPLTPVVSGTTTTRGGSFGAVAPGFGFVTPGFGAVTPGFGTVGFGNVGFGGFGLVPIAGTGGKTGGFGSIGGFDDGFGADPATIALIAGIVREALGRLGGGGTGGGGLLPPPKAPAGTLPAPAGVPNAALAEINAKLDAILVNQAVQTATILKALEDRHKETDAQLKSVLDKLDKIKAQTDKIK